MSARITRVPPRRTWIQAFLLLAVSGRSVVSAQHVRLRVTSDTLDTPVPRATVVLLNDRAVWQTDDDGVLYVSVLHPGANVFTIRHIGLAPLTTTVDVPGSGTRAVHVIMRPAAVVLDTMSVTAPVTLAQLTVFDDRRLHNVGGQFITWADIARQRPRETIDLFRRVLGLQVITPPKGEPFIESTRGYSPGTGPCMPRVGLDGMVLQSAGQPLDVNDVAPGDIYGIEIYSGAATIPGQYLSSAAGGSCGLIMIWTLNASHQITKRP